MHIYNNLSEHDLVRLLKQDDTRALSRLYYLHVKQLQYFILKAAKSPFFAEDIVHDTFVKIWENRQNIDPDQPFKPYLYTIAKRHLLNLLKRARHESSIMEEIKKHTLESENSTELSLDYSESNFIFKEAIKCLPDRCREVFVRCRMQGLTYKQVADELGIAESTVNNQMVKALKSIREFITFRNALLVILLHIIK